MLFAQGHEEPGHCLERRSAEWTGERSCAWQRWAALRLPSGRIRRWHRPSPETPDRSRSTAPVWQGAPGIARQRIEGFAKVSGAKIYAADFRARDMPGWPGETAHALLVKATDASHVFDGIDLDLLSAELRPDRVVLAADLAAAKITVPGFYAGDLLCPLGQTPLYLGQPLALLIWNDFARFSAARSAIAALTGLREDRRQDRTGRSRSPMAPITSCALPGRRRTATTSIPRSRPDGQSRRVTSMRSRNGRLPRRPARPMPRRRSTVTRSGPGSQTAGADTLVLDRTFQTQSIDPVFLEPESALAWYDPGRRTLEFVVGVQSPHWIATEHRLAGREQCAGHGGQGYRRPLRLCRRRLRRPRLLDLSALRSDRRAVLAGQAGPAGQQPLRPVSVRAEAPRLQHPQPDRGRQGERKNDGVRLRSGTRRRRPCQSLRRRCARRRGGDRSACTTCRRST